MPIEVTPEGKVDLPKVIVKAHYSAQEVGQVNPWWRTSFGLDNMGRADGVIVGVVDTGADEAHSLHGDLAGVWLKHRDFSNSASAWAAFFHGTHVGGIIGALDNGTGIIGGAPGVRLLNAKALGDDGSGTDLAVANAIRWCVDEGASIINCSLGSSQPSSAISAAVDYAVQHGVLVLAASGNDGAQNGVSDPADLDGTIAVGAVDRQRNIAPFSNQGVRVQCVGAGVDILSCYGHGGYALLSGTSMATPHVASMFALVVAAAKRNIGVVEASKMLAECCDDLGTAGRDKATGFGVPNLAKMLAMVKPKPALPPAPTPVVPPGVPSLNIKAGEPCEIIQHAGKSGIFIAGQ